MLCPCLEINLEFAIHGREVSLRSSNLGVRLIPRYRMEASAHLKSKYGLKWSTTAGFIETLSAWDLVMLTRNPEISPKDVSNLQILGREVTRDVTKSRRSSANSAHLCTCCPQFTPFILWSDLIAIASVSIAIAKINGDRGQPCLVPLAILIGSEK